MTNENLKVDDVLKHLCITYSSMAKEQYPSSDDCENVYAAVNLIKSQQSRIDLLESAIREFIYKPDTKNSLGANIYVETLRNLMENKS